MSPTFQAVTVAAVLGCGIVAGVFFAFSTWTLGNHIRTIASLGAAAAFALALIN